MSVAESVLHWSVNESAMLCFVASAYIAPSSHGSSPCVKTCSWRDPGSAAASAACSRLTDPASTGASSSGRRRNALARWASTASLNAVSWRFAMVIEAAATSSTTVDASGALWRGDQRRRLVSAARSSPRRLTRCWLSSSAARTGGGALGPPVVGSSPSFSHSWFAASWGLPATCS